MPPAILRVLDWLLCRPQIREAREAARLSPREDALVRRAKSALAAANHLLEAPERTGEGLAGAHAGVLYLESLYWCLYSSRAELERPDLPKLWDEARVIVGEIGLSPKQAGEAKRLIAIEKPSLELPELAEREQEAAAVLLRQIAARALDIRLRNRRALDLWSIKRALRITLVLGLFVVLVLGVRALLPEKRDLAAGKRWTTSSKAYDCHPNRNECGGAATRILFHTREERDPWFQYDLGQPMQFSSMTIVNRQDAVQERASPLIVEASDDGTKFREVIRREGTFSVWKPSFAKQTARYVRVRIPKKAFLHLESVRIHP